MTFDSLFGPSGADAFLAEYWGRRFGHFPGAADRFAGLFSWSELSEILEWQSVDLPQLRLYKEGKPLDRLQYMLDHHGMTHLRSASLVNCLADGATLIFDSIDAHAPQLRALARSFEAALRSDTVINLYAAWRTQHGFDVHWDSQDTCILQVCGKKRWQVFEPTRVHPLKEDVDRPVNPRDAPVWDGVLEQGAMLYLPRGWWHAAFPVDEPSLHLTVTVVPPTGADLLTWLANRMKSHAAIRQNVPVWSTVAGRAQHWGTLRELISTELTDALCEEFAAEWGATLMPRPRIDFPAAPVAVRDGLGPRALVRLATARNLDLLERPDGTIVFYANGSKWECPGHFAAALKELRGDQETQVGRLCELVSGGERAQLTSFLAVLQMGGVLWTRNPSDV